MNEKVSENLELHPTRIHDKLYVDEEINIKLSIYLKQLCSKIYVYTLHKKSTKLKSYSF